MSKTPAFLLLMALHIPNPSKPKVGHNISKNVASA